MYKSQKNTFQEIRNELLDRNRNKLTKMDLVKYLKDINEYNITNYDGETLKQNIKTFQRTKYLMMWHDCPTIGGHSYLLMMVACMYDPACYFTDIEFHQKYNEHVNIQAIVETPRIYILARCPSNDQQLLYSEERLDDILKLNKNVKTSNNIEIIDKLHIFKEDKPASQFEAGQQKGRNFYCFLCATKVENARSYILTYCKYVETITDHIKIVNKIDIFESKTNSQKIKLYDNLNKDELIAELKGRDVKFSCTESKNNLQSKLKDVIHGIQRVPALIYSNSINDISQLNLQS